MATTTLVQSLLRGLSILEQVGQSPDGLSVQQVAQLLDLKAPTAHNLLKTLTQRGFLEKTTAPVRYRLGPAVLSLAEGHMQRSLLQRAQTTLAELAGQMPQVKFSLAEPAGGEIVVVMAAGPGAAGLVRHQRGPALNPYASASPLMFQAFWAAESRDQFRQNHPFSEYGLRLWPSVERLEQFLQDARQKGYVHLEFPGDALAKLAAPVRGRSGEVLAALGASLPTGTLSESALSELIQRLRQAAEALSSNRKT